MVYTSDLCKEILPIRGEYTYLGKTYKLGEVVESITAPNESILLKIVSIQDKTTQLMDPMRQVQMTFNGIDYVTFQIISENYLQVEVSPFSILKIPKVILDKHIDANPSWFI